MHFKLVLLFSLVLVSCVLDKTRDNPKDLAGVAFSGASSSSQILSGSSSSAISSNPVISSSSTLTTQIITFEAISQKTMGSADFAVSVGSTSNLAVTITSETPTVCTVMGTIVHLVATGSCQLIASQPGDGTFAPATNVSQSFVIADPTKKDQSIVFGALVDRIIGETFSLSANSTSGLAVTFGSVTPSTCVVDNLTVNIIAAGICTISAAQGGDPTWNAAQTMTQSFVIKKKTQTITLGTISNQTMGTGPISLTASLSGSNATVIFTSQTPSVCTITGNEIHLVSTGDCEIVASALGDDIYEAPTSERRTFTIYPANNSSSMVSSSSLALSSSTILSSSSNAAGNSNLVIDAANFDAWGADGGATYNDAQARHQAYFVPDGDAISGGNSAILAPDGSLIGPCPKDDATCVPNWKISATQVSGVSVASKLRVTAFVPASTSGWGWAEASWWLIPSVNTNLTGVSIFDKSGPFGLDKNGTIVLDISYTAGQPLTIRFSGKDIDPADGNQAPPRYIYNGRGTREKVSIKVSQVSRPAWSVPVNYDPANVKAVSFNRVVEASLAGAKFPTTEPVTTDFEFWSASLPITYGSAAQIPLP